MMPGDTLLIGGPETAGGTYNVQGTRVTITNSGSPTQRMTIRGVDRGHGYPVLQMSGTGTRSNSGIRFDPGVGYWTVENIGIYRRDIGFETAGDNPGLIFNNCEAISLKTTGFLFRGCTNLIVNNCRAYLYDRRGFHFISGNENVTVTDCTADFTGPDVEHDETRAALSGVEDPVGFYFHINTGTTSPNKNIVLKNCVALDNIESGDSYNQGDGFMAERLNEGLTFLRCKALRNRDGGFDLKGTNQLIKDCVSNHNRLGFKIWYDGSLVNCIAVGNTQRGIYVASQSTAESFTITATNCTVHSATNSGVANVAIEKPLNTLKLTDCLLTFAGAGGTYVGSTGTFQHFNVSGTTVVSGTTPRHAYAANTANAPKYNNPVLPWEGNGTNYDNQTYGLTRGYSSTRVGVGDPDTTPSSRVISVNLCNGTGNALLPTEVVGAVPAANWTNSYNASEWLPDVKDDTGAVTTADVTFGGAAYGYANNTGALPPPMDDDVKMMSSMRGNTSNGVVTATVEQLPYSGYDVYVYWGGRASGQSIPATLTVEYQVEVGGVWTTVDTRYIRDNNRVWDGTYDESTATAAGDAVDGNEYVTFRNRSEGKFRIRTSGNTRTGLSGFQIVSH